MLMRNDRVLGAVGSMIIWAVYFVAAYSLQGLGCNEGWHEVRVAGGNLLTVSLVGLTVIAFALIVWNGWRGWQGWRETTDRAARAAAVRDRHRFFALLMMWLAGLSSVATVLVAVPIIMLAPCAA